MSEPLASDPALARRRLATVASVASLILHSGRGRLAVARNALEILQARMEGDLDDEQRSAFLAQMDLFLEEFNLGVEMIRCHDGPLEAVAVEAEIANAIDVVRSRADRSAIGLEASLGGLPGPVRAVRNLLRVALLNLLRNAIESLESAEPAGGAQPRIVVRAIANGTLCRIEVEDNGPGVPPALRSRLFREYVTGRKGGTGLGLSLSRDALSAMGGTIAHATPDGSAGALFRLELPFA